MRRLTHLRGKRQGMPPLKGGTFLVVSREPSLRNLPGRDREQGAPAIVQ